jgi:hypothetical protein
VAAPRYPSGSALYLAPAARARGIARGVWPAGMQLKQQRSSIVDPIETFHINFVVSGAFWKYLVHDTF